MSLTLPSPPKTAETQSYSTPALPLSELTETPEAFELVVELPGVSRENLDITVENGQLRLFARRAGPDPGRALVRELSQGDWAREFRLGSTVDTARISAKLDRGILRLRLPKLPQSQLRHIPLEVVMG
ncbi:MAG: hypothetical protein RLZZ399_2224 [Verrucomicrobiota bacterium]|jgi:HSP20 family molecular chaperone IbpA